MHISLISSSKHTHTHGHIHLGGRFLITTQANGGWAETCTAANDVCEVRANTSYESLLVIRNKGKHNLHADTSEIRTSFNSIVCQPRELMHASAHNIARGIYVCTHLQKRCVHIYTGADTYNMGAVSQI